METGLRLALIMGHLLAVQSGYKAVTVYMFVLKMVRQPWFATGRQLAVGRNSLSLMPVMEKLLEEWKASGFEFATLQQLYDSLDLSALPKQEIAWAEVDGRSGLLAVQNAWETSIEH